MPHEEISSTATHDRGYSSLRLLQIMVNIIFLNIIFF